MKCKKCENIVRSNGLCAKCCGAEWYLKNKEKVQARKKKWYEENYEKKIADTKAWKKANPEKVKNIDANRDRNKIFLYYKKRYDSDLNYRLKVIIRNRLKTALKHNFKSGKTLDLLGCSIKEFRAYIESKWEIGMSWDNHTNYGWHIDHIIPLNSFDLSNPEQLRKASHYTNMQLLWWKDNLKKRNELI